MTLTRRHTPMHLPHLVRTLLAVASLSVLTLGACGERASTAALPWTMAVDSTGDTIRVRITGDVPDSLVRTLEVDLSIGEADGADELTFGRIGGIVVGQDGTMFVHDADQTVGLIRMFDTTGTYVRTVGAKGGGPGEYGQLNGFALASNGDLLLWDGAGSRVNRYASDGSFKSAFLVPVSGMFTANGLHVASDGTISLSAVIGREEIANGPPLPIPGFIRFDSLGALRDSVAYPRWTSVKPATLRVDSPDGTRSSLFGIPFQPSVTTTLLRDGGVVGGYADRYAFTIIGAGAKPRQVMREVAAVPVSDTEAAERRAQIEQNAKRTNPGFSWTGPGIPATKPSFSNISVTDDGRLWVRVAQPAVPIPEAELPPLRTDVVPPPVRLTTREPIAYDIYAAAGELRGRVKLPPRTTVFHVRGDFAWGISRDADDVEFATRFRVTP
ncbi:MAG: 6-bladed beta-propeller [Gemmatimonadaceae bacterium]|nr:6-bladed beta-propeller [Gemmatimonadaceae bacterium]